MSNIEKEQSEKLLQLVNEAVEKDKALRDKFKVGDKFRFIRDRLHALLARVEENLTSMQTEDAKRTDVLQEDEMVIYVYLFNAHGIMVPTWKKLIQPSVFYEYSVNRPVYLDKTHVEASIRSKPNKVQHGYLAIAVKKADILPDAEGGPAKDAIGNPISRVREGALVFTRLISFHHNEHEYVVSSEGELIKKE